jgi:uroporphyrinogen decarboxylase
MSPRDRALAALRRQVPDRVPIFMRMTPPVLDLLKARTGFDTPEEYFDFEIREVAFLPTKDPRDYRVYFENWPDRDALEITEWGLGRQPGSLYHFRKLVPPMQHFTRLDEFEEYPFPDVTANYRLEGVPERIRQIKERGYAVRGRLPEVNGTLWESAWPLRGMDNFLEDMLERKELAHCLLDRILAVHAYNAERFVRAGIDILHLSEDLGTQESLIMSPALFREFVKPRLAKLIARAKTVNPAVLIFLHSDGAIEPLIPDLIEIGVNILNPIQPECMDPTRIKAAYGHRLSFWGTVGTQTTFPFAMPDEMRAVVRERIMTVGKGGGFLIAPTHKIMPEVPWENIETFVVAAREHGQYDAERSWG